LQGKGPCGKEASGLDLNFCFFCFNTKEVARRGNKRHEATNYKIKKQILYKRKKPGNTRLFKKE